jgi:hypothetical protein
VHLLRDGLGGGVAARHLDQRRVVQQAVGQGLDLVAEGGREQQALLLGRQQASTFLMSWMKPMSSMRSASSSTKIST